MADQNQGPQIPAQPPEPASVSAAGAPVASEVVAQPTHEEQVAALQKQLTEQKAKIDELTGQALAQNDPATADPSVDVKGLLNQLVDAQSEYRNEIAALRAEVSKARRAPVPSTTVQTLSAEELATQRQNEIAEYEYYCPGCGRLYHYQRECSGRPEAPHPPIEVVSTDELKNPPDASDKEAVQKYQDSHTAMEYVDPQTNALLLEA